MGTERTTGNGNKINLFSEGRRGLIRLATGWNGYASGRRRRNGRPADSLVDDDLIRSTNSSMARKLKLLLSVAPARGLRLFGRIETIAIPAALMNNAIIFF